MILKTDALKTKNGCKGLIHHLLGKPEDNEVIDIVQGSASRIKQSYDISTLNGCKEGCIHFKLSPDPNLIFSEDNWNKSLSEIGKEFGFNPVDATVVQHTKKGRTHQHIIIPAWDISKGKKVNLWRSKLRSQKVVKKLELSIENKLTPVGPYSQKRLPTLVSDPAIKEAIKASPKAGVSFTNTDTQKAKRYGYDMSSLRQKFQQAISVSDNERSFNTALSELGFKIEHKVSNTGRRRLTITSLEHPKFTLDATHATGMKLKQLRTFLEGKNYHVFQQRKITTPEVTSTNQTNHPIQDSTDRQERPSHSKGIRTTSKDNGYNSNQERYRGIERSIESQSHRRTVTNSANTRSTGIDRTTTRDTRTQTRQYDGKSKHTLRKKQRHSQRVKELFKPISPSDYIMALYGLNSGFNRDIQLPKRYIFSVT
ncbi:Endonuclease relaxase [Parasaccharibacter apium]|uniref:Endonuclease relaxase n=1 Tax=Parasaccharibacter apium TaxID=1510841 RepID=A0A7U7G675_9PROT|nr:relaxase/mobilization nuclease domain-containing protein [Parasaccharibacter apium]CDG33924.1 Endonuclease relaxase [Parasaccharibacter apium]